MRLIFQLLAAIALAVPVSAQEPGVSPAHAEQSPAQDAGAGLPVSLERIREGLQRPADAGLKNLDAKADFSVQIEDQRHIDEMLAKLDFRSGPAPAGGLYAYEQQRMLFNPTSHPLQQPYAAFSGGEFVTIAIENLLRSYLGGKIGDAIGAARQSRGEAAAREEVSQNIATYCAGRPDRADIQLCTAPFER